MKSTKYLIRLDDACPTMDMAKWENIKLILDKYNIHPLIGIIPDNKDTAQILNEPNPVFWDFIRDWKKEGCSIALHGYDHVYLTNNPGINPFWEKSEFAGLSLNEQEEKIQYGYDILINQKLRPKFFFAPSHTFDHNTLIALKNRTSIRYISDGVAFYPYKEGEFVFIPQLFGHCVNIPFKGIYTFCFHPNKMTDQDFEYLEKFLFKYHKRFISFDGINMEDIKELSWKDKILKYIFFFQRKLRRLI